MFNLTTIPAPARSNMETYQHDLAHRVKVTFNWAEPMMDRLNRCPIHPAVALVYSALCFLDGAEVSLSPQIDALRSAIDSQAPTISTKDGSQVAYLRDSSRMDRWTVCPPLRWILRAVPDLQITGSAADALARIGDAYCEPLTHTLLDSVEAMVDHMADAHANGVSFGSCMTAPRLGRRFHPYRVYAPALGWAVCLVSQGGQIIGRALVNEGRFVRMYANTCQGINLATEYLTGQGFTQVPGWRGCKVARIENGDGSLVGPYMDGSANNAIFDPDGDTLTIQDSGPVSFCLTSGIAEYAGNHEGQVEDYNGDWIDEDDAVYVESVDGYVHRDDVCSCESCDEYILEQDSCEVYYMGHGGALTSRYVCEGCRDSDYTEIRLKHYYRYIHNDDLVCLHDGEYALERDTVCLHDGEYALADDTVCLHDGEYALAGDAVQLANGEYALAGDAVADGNGGYILLADLETKGGE